MDAYLLDALTAYINGERAGPKPLPAEYMDLNGDGQELDSEDLAVAQAAFAHDERVGGERTVWRYSVGDHLGSMTHVTDSVGDLVASCDGSAAGPALDHRLRQKGLLGQEDQRRKSQSTLEGSWT